MPQSAQERIVRTPDGMTHRFPADATDAEIGKVLNAQAPAEPGQGKQKPTTDTVGTGLRETLLPFPGTQEFLDFLKDPYMGMWNIFKGEAKAHWETGKKVVAKAKETITAPTLKGKALAASETIGYTGATLLPLAGPQAAETGEIWPTQPRRAIGRTIGLITPFVVAELGRRVSPTKIAGTPTAERPVPLTHAERTGGTVSRYMENISEKSLMGGGAFKAFRQRQQSALIDTMAERVIQRVSAFKGTAGDLMDQLGKELASSQERMRAVVDAEYAQLRATTKTTIKRTPQTTMAPSKGGLVDAQGRPVQIPKRTMVKSEVGGVQVRTRSIKGVAVQLIKELRGEQQLLKHAALATHEADLLKMMKAPEYISFTDMHAARSSLLKIARKFDDPIPGKEGGIAKKLADVTDKAMTDAAHQVGEINPETGLTDLETQVRTANRHWRELTFEFNESIIAKLLETKPDMVPAAIRQTPVADLRYLKTHLTTDAWNMMTSYILRDTLESALTEKLVPMPGGSAAYNAAAERMHLPKLAKETSRALPGGAWAAEINKYGDRVAVLLPPETFTSIAEVDELARRISEKGSVPGIFAAGLNAGLILDTLYSLNPLHFSLYGVAAAGVTAGGTKLLAHLITHPEGLTTLRSFVRAVNGKVPAQIQYWALRIGQLTEGVLPQQQKPQQAQSQQPPVGVR